MTFSTWRTSPDAPRARNRRARPRWRLGRSLLPAERRLQLHGDPGGHSATRVRLYELAAHGLQRIPFSRQLRLARLYKDTHFLLHIPRNQLEANALLVAAVAGVLDGMEPGWVAAVEGARGSRDDPDAVAFWSRVPIEAVLAVIGDRRTRL